MVWHAYQLNPRNFLEDCVSFDKMDAWRTGLPWAPINACIDNESFEYGPGAEAEQLFQSRTKNCWNSLEDPQLAEVECPNCEGLNDVPWTKWNTLSAWRTNGKGEYYGHNDATGYADKDFSFTCKYFNCSYRRQEVTHSVLRTQKFRKDCASLKHHDIPMQGTCLDNNGKHRPTHFHLHS